MAKTPQPRDTGPDSGPHINEWKPYSEWVKENSPPGSIGKKLEESMEKPPKDTGK